MFKKFFFFETNFFRLTNYLYEIHEKNVLKNYFRTNIICLKFFFIYIYKLYKIYPKKQTI